MEFKHTHAKSADDPRLVNSVRLIDPDDDVYSLIQIPQWAFIVDVWLHKLLAATAAGALVSVGFTGNGETADPDAFIDVILGEADALGVVRAIHDGQPASRGKWFNDAGGSITLTCDDNGGTGGTFMVTVLYYIIH